MAINFAGLSVPKPLIVNVLLPFVNTNLSSVKISVEPSVLIKTYLSSSKGKKVNSSEPEITAPVEFEEIVTSNCFLIVRLESVKSTEETFCFGRTVYNVLSNASWKLEDRILKSLGLISVVGRLPSQIPDTDVTLDSVSEFCDTDSTLENVGTDNPGFEYATKLPTVAIPTKYFDKSALVTVLIPPEPALMFTRPITLFELWITSPLNVDAAPTIP